MKKTKPDEVGCAGGLWIFPGTKLYRHAMKQGFIDDSFWLTDEPYKIYTVEHSLADLSKMEQRLYSYKGRLRGMINIAMKIASKVVQTVMRITR